MNKNKTLVVVLVVVIVALLAYILIKPKNTATVSSESATVPSDQTATLDNQNQTNYQPSTNDVSSCLPNGVSNDTVVSVDMGGSNKVTVGQKLATLNASCNDKQLVDGNKKPITFYNLIGCWGTPPPGYQQSLKNQDAAIKALQSKYTVITLTCNPSGVPYQ